MTAFDADRPVHLQQACMHLRHKLMYVDERQATPGLVDTNSDTRVFFCAQTCDSLGPDAEAVHPEDCTCDRACYRGGT